MNHPNETELQDWVDGVLDPSESARVVAHIETCDACSAEVVALRSLLADLHSLPRSIEPDVDLRPGIAAALDETSTVAHARWFDRSLRSLRAPLAAAALLLVALSSIITARLVRPAAETVAGDPAAAIEARYAAAIRELETLLREKRSELPPQALALLGESLTVIDAALAETRAALREQPENPALEPVLVATYERKLALLRGAAALDAES